MKTTVFVFIMYCGCREACQVQYSYRLSFALSNTEQCVIMAGCKCKHFSLLLSDHRYQLFYIRNRYFDIVCNQIDIFYIL